LFTGASPHDIASAGANGRGGWAAPLAIHPPTEGRIAALPGSGRR
jgi:hypothetical protein